MIIKNVEGRWQTVRTDSESIEGLFGAIDKMSVEERKLLRMVFSQLCKNETTVIRTLQNLEYEEPPASPEKFLTDPYYFGEVGKGLYPWVKEDIARLFNQGFEEIVLTGAQRTGKDTFAHIAVSYLLHLLLCLKDPATSYGLAKGSMIHTVLLSATQEMAKEIVFGGLIEKIKQSPWFSKFGKSMKVLSEEIRFPKGLVVKGAESTDLGVIGLSTCVTGDTRINTPLGEKTIDYLLIKYGKEKFPIFNYSGDIVESDLAFITEMGVKPVYALKLTDGFSLRITGDHKILIDPKLMQYKSLSELSIGDSVCCELDLKVVFRKIEEKMLAEDCKVYDLTARKNPNFIANRTFVHNCAVIIDEANIGRKVKAVHERNQLTDRTEAIYQAVKRRIRTTFMKQGRPPTLLMTIGSRRYPSDFVERRIRELQNDKSALCKDLSLWQARGLENFSPKMFKVLVGNDTIPSRVLPEGEQPPQGMQIISVPYDFYKDFVDDCEGCFTGDTQISLLDGSEVAIQDLVGRKEFWTYSYTSDGKLHSGRGHSARLTRKDAPIVEVLLDNGEKVRCTPNHRFMLRDGTYKEAGFLQAGDSLMPLYRKRDRHGYELVKSNVGGKWVYTHRVVSREAFFNGGQIPEDLVIHHRNFKIIDNSPENLAPLTTEAHINIHKSNLIRSIHSPYAKLKSVFTRKRKVSDDPSYRKMLLKNLKIGLDKYVGSDAHRATASKIGKFYGFGSNNPNILRARSENGTRNITLLNLSSNNPCYKEENRKKASERLKRMPMEARLRSIQTVIHNRFHKGPKEGCLRCANPKRRRPKNIPPMSPFECSQRGAHKYFHEGPYETCQKCHGPKPLKIKFSSPAEAGRFNMHKRWKHPTSFETCGICHRKQNAKYSTCVHEKWHSGEYENCKSCFPVNNHKVVSATPAGVADVYDITVDTYNNFSLSSGIVVHNSLRDIGGISIRTLSPYFSNQKMLREMFDEGRSHPCRTVEWRIDEHLDIQWEKLTQVVGGKMQPILFPDKARCIAIDLGRTKNPTGFVCGFVKGFKTVERKQPDGRIYHENQPYIVVEFTLRISPVAGEEVKFWQVRELLFKFIEHGIPIKYAVMDHWQCLTGDTRIILLSGKEIPIKDLESLYPNNTPFWVYSYDTKNGKVVPGKASAVGKTGEKVPIVEVTLDNGEKIRCTKNHPFLLSNGTYKNAEGLKENDSLMAVYRRIDAQKVVSVRDAGFEDVYDISVDTYHNFAVVSGQERLLEKQGLNSGVFVHNSDDFAQLLTEQGIETTKIKTDINAYETLKNAVYEGRIRTYPYKPLLDELSMLEYDAKKMKVDTAVEDFGNIHHDVADSVCLLVNRLSKGFRAQDFSPVSPETDYVKPQGENGPYQTVGIGETPFELLPGEKSAMQENAQPEPTQAFPSYGLMFNGKETGWGDEVNPKTPQGYVPISKQPIIRLEVLAQEFCSRVGIDKLPTVTVESIKAFLFEKQLTDHRYVNAIKSHIERVYVDKLGGKTI